MSDALHELETQALAEIRAFTPLCFRNLLTPDLERWTERDDGERMLVDPEIGSIQARPEDGGVSFEVMGRLRVGSAGRNRFVTVHGSRDDDGTIGFRVIEAQPA